MMKILEIWYDIASLPGRRGAPASLMDALDFRNAAGEPIEAAMMEAGLGEWVGAEIGAGEVNFGLDVQDFDAFEAAVRACVAGTPHAGTRKIAQRGRSRRLRLRP